MGVTIHYNGRAKNRAAVDRIMHAVMVMASEWEWPFAQVEDPDGEIVRMCREARDAEEQARVKAEGTDRESLGISFVSEDGSGADGVEVYQGPVYMMVVNPGEGCEPLRLMFDRDHRMDGFTKTQYGPVETHVRMCRILRAIERHFEVLEVYDESGYWDTEDRAVLEERIGTEHNTKEGLAARIEAAKRKKALEDMYRLDEADE